MTPSEVWLFIDAKTPEKRYGNMSQSSYDRLLERREELEAQGVKVM